MKLTPYSGKDVTLEDLISTGSSGIFSDVLEPSVKTFEGLFEIIPRIRDELKEVRVDEKLDSLSIVGELWKNPNYERRKRLTEVLPITTGYHPNMVNFEVSLIPEILKGGVFEEILDNPACFPGGKKAIEDFVEITDGHYIKANPLGSLFIIGAGNAVIPPLISLIVSNLTNNFTILRPSLANYVGLWEIASSFADAGEVSNSSRKDALRRMSNAIVITYMSHNSEAYDYLLTQSDINGVNFWGGEPALSEIRGKVAKNPNGPRFIVNGPMTGYAIIDGDYLSEQNIEEVTKKLAYNMLLYQQKLCNSPTDCTFIGSFEDATNFGKHLAKSLSELYETFPITISDVLGYKTQMIRKGLKRKGSKIFTPETNGPEWTVVVSDGKFVLDDVASDNLSYHLYEGSIFLEIVATQNMEQAIRNVKDLPKRNRYIGIERVQTVSYAMDSDKVGELARHLSDVGVYRIVPFEHTFVRSMLEPDDGEYLPRKFTFLSYLRK